MTIAKTKTAAMLAAALALAGGPAAISQTIPEMSSKDLRTAPPVAVVRPSEQWKKGGKGGSFGDGKMLFHNLRFDELLEQACSFPISRMVLPPNAPTNQFDSMVTVHDHKKEALQKAIEEQTGFTACREERPTDVLVFRLKDPALAAVYASEPAPPQDAEPSPDPSLPAAHPGKPTRQLHSKTPKRWMAHTNYPVRLEVPWLEMAFCKPILVDPALSGNFDWAFHGPYSKTNSEAIIAALAEAGMELVPTNMPVPMLVVSQKGLGGRSSGSLHHAWPFFQGDLAAFQSDTAGLQGDAATLQGTWEGPELIFKMESTASIVFAGTNMEYRCQDRIPNEWYKATFSLREDTNPRQLIAVVTESPNLRFIGETVNAIYRIKNRVLTITARGPGDSPPASFDASAGRLLELKKDKP